MKKPAKKKQTKPTKAELQTQQQVTLEDITKLLDGDTALAEFFLIWLGNGRNATKAYQKLHPNVTDESAAVLGSTLLRNIKVSVVLEALGMGVGKYFEQLSAGLNAEKKAVLRKYDRQGNLVQEIDLSQPDHKTRRLYHEPLGKMLELEKDKGNQTLNYFDFSRLGSMIKADEIERGLVTK